MRQIWEQAWGQATGRSLQHHCQLRGTCCLGLKQGMGLWEEFQAAQPSSCVTDGKLVAPEWRLHMQALCWLLWEPEIPGSVSEDLGRCGVPVCAPGDWVAFLATCQSVILGLGLLLCCPSASTINNLKVPLGSLSLTHSLVPFGKGGAKG